MPFAADFCGLHCQLQHYLQTRIPGSHLEATGLPQVPEITLQLINRDYPRDGLTREQAEALMDDPPYWGFCWASGQVLARWLLDNPDQVRGKTLVDFGAGSGVVAIVARLAGAARAIACDLDPRALLACRLNALGNGIHLEFSPSLDTLLDSDLGPDSLLAVADVFYDRANLPLLATLLRKFPQLLVADSRLKGQPLQGMTAIGTFISHTVPDLDESQEFNRVTLYRRQ